MDFSSDEEESEEKPKYSVILSEEEYEDEDDVPGQPSLDLQDNFEEPDPSPQIEGWDPRESHFDFFRIR